MIQALSFDAAGTLIEPAEPVAETYARLLSPHLGALDPADLKAAFPRAFNSAGIPDYGAHPDGDTAERQWWHRVVEATVGQAVEAAAFGALFDYYASGKAWRVFDEVTTVLHHCRELGFRLIVVSNFDRRLHSILADLALVDHFECILTSADARARKPSPEIFRNALGQLNLKAGEVLHVGDSSDADQNGPRTLGMEAFLLERPATDLRDFLDWVQIRRGI
ncbi:MAG: HAD-IA family hydrolase [Verrucomicrobiota bacterium]